MTALRVRPPAVAGSFYPDDANVLLATVEGALDAAAVAGAASGSTPTPKALVVPHAGYIYSGPVAASAYARLLPTRDRIERVVLLGPAHRARSQRVAAPSADGFQTPLGLVRVDGAGRDDLVAAGLIVVDDKAHATEHSLEVQLPFIQVALGAVTVLPLAVGHVPAAEVAAVLDHVWGGPETVVIVSTDLSHYHDQRTAQQVDRRTAAAIMAKRAADVGPDDACGVYALRGLLLVAGRRALDVELLDLRTSADTAGDPDRVVGYGAFALSAELVGDDTQPGDHSPDPLTGDVET